MEERAQVSLEYLLIIVAGIIFVTIVALFIKNAAQSTTQAIKEN